MSLSNSSFILKNDGTLWVCGQNGYGQLGLGGGASTIFTKAADTVKSVYCGYDHTMILKNDGTLLGCGYNNWGQLGLGNINDRTTFTKITTNTDNIKSVYCGIYNTSILKNDGTLWACGYNGEGQLGLGDWSERTTFTQVITNVNDIKSVCCGSYYAVMSKNDGTLWGCGRNSHGQLGLEDKSNRNIFTIINSAPENIKMICCGEHHTIVLKNDGTLWGSGYNVYGQLGLGDANDRTIFTKITDNVKSVYCGYDHTIILKNNNTLWGCGHNNNGQLGLGDTNDRTTFTQITINTNNIKSVYCGRNHTIILKNDGTLWGCGYNSQGQLGLGKDKSDKITFTQIITNTDNIKCFANDYPVLPSIIKIYDTTIGYVETLDANNFRSVSVSTVERLKVLCIKPKDTFLSCLISFDKKQTWKAFDGANWNTISNISPENIILNGMEVDNLNKLDKNKLISGGFTGDLDFKIAMKTNDVNKTPSVTKIYIEYK